MTSSNFWNLQSVVLSKVLQESSDGVPYDPWSNDYDLRSIDPLMQDMATWSQVQTIYYDDRFQDILTRLTFSSSDQY